MKKIKIDDENGRGHETTLYNLNVLNQLAMVCIDNGKPYVIGTLRTKLSPILQTVSAKFRYSVSEETVVVDGGERKTPYYHKDVCNMVEKVITPQWLRHFALCDSRLTSDDLSDAH